MTFEEAVDRLIEGQFVRRKGWSKNSFIAVPGEPKLGSQIKLGPIYVLQAAPFMTRWRPHGVGDFTANDWEVIGFTVQPIEECILRQRIEDAAVVSLARK